MGIRDDLYQRWKSIPSQLRKPLVLVGGAALLLIGLALVVLPGPFTLPFVIAGIAVLGSEFAWANALMDHGKRNAGKLWDWMRRHATPLAIVLLSLAIAVGTAAVVYFLG